MTDIGISANGGSVYSWDTSTKDIVKYFFGNHNGFSWAYLYGDHYYTACEQIYQYLDTSDSFVCVMENGYTAMGIHSPAVHQQWPSAFTIDPKSFYTPFHLQWIHGFALIKSTNGGSDGVIGKYI